MIRPLAPRNTRRAPRWAAVHRVAGLLVALAVISALAQARLHYFYCEALGLSLTDPCAKSDDGRPPCPVDLFQSEHRDCCQRITMPALPDGARPGGPQIAPASVVAEIPAVFRIHMGWTRPGPSLASQHARSRASPRLASERCATLMVFLT